MYADSVLYSTHAKRLGITQKLQNYSVEGQLQIAPFWYFWPFRFRDCYSALYCSTQLRKFVTHNAMLEMFAANALKSTHAKRGWVILRNFRIILQKASYRSPRFGIFRNSGSETLIPILLACALSKALIVNIFQHSIMGNKFA